MGFTTLTPLPLNNPHLWDNSGPFKTNPLSVLVGNLLKDLNIF
nr:MAG TPA: hypothetical protein [Caudoviricetes sp.]